MRPFQSHDPKPPTYAEQQIDLTPSSLGPHRPSNLIRRLAKFATVVFYVIAIGSIALQLTL